MSGMIDAHAHLDARFGGRWIDRPASALLEVMDTCGVDLIVDLSGGWGAQTLHRHLSHYKAAAPERFVHLAGVDWSSWSRYGAAFGRQAAQELDRQLDRGAGGLKIWKDLGLLVRDDRGELARLDDSRLDPIWAVCSARAVPVVIHVGDPIEYFGPLREAGPYADELKRQPEWHWFEQRAIARNVLHHRLRAWLSRWPQLIVVGAHLLDLLDDPATLAAILDDHSGLHVDLGARFHLLDQNPGTMRCLFERSDRVLFGLDHPPSSNGYTRAMNDTIRAWYGAASEAGALARADADVAAVLHDNARRIFKP